jgi:catechol 2,3-dioxygenase-like lactoylglutathione lyase family enzyme
MTVPARISLVTLAVADVARATAFYEGLGWARSSISTDGVSFFATADGVLSLYAHADFATDAGIEAGDRPPTGGVALAINVSSDDEVGDVLAQAEAAGGTVQRPASRAPWGGWFGFFADPDGHLWEVAHNPGFAFDDRGSVVLPG